MNKLLATAAIIAATLGSIAIANENETEGSFDISNFRSDQDIVVQVSGNHKGLGWTIHRRIQYGQIKNHTNTATSASHVNCYANVNGNFAWDMPAANVLYWADFADIDHDTDSSELLSQSQSWESYYNGLNTFNSWRWARVCSLYIFGSDGNMYGKNHFRINEVQNSSLYTGLSLPIQREALRAHVNDDYDTFETYLDNITNGCASEAYEDAYDDLASQNHSRETAVNELQYHTFQHCQDELP